MPAVDSKISSQRLYDELVRRQSKARGGLRAGLKSVVERFKSGKVQTSMDRFLQRVNERVRERDAKSRAVDEVPDAALEKHTTEELVSQLKAVSGTDDRRDLFKVKEQLATALANEVLNPREARYLANARSVACIAIDQMVAETASGQFLLQPNQTLGENMGLCANERFRDQPVVGLGTAFLVAPDQVLTAHHVASSASFLEGMRVIFDFMLEADPAPHVVPPGWKLPGEAVHEIESVVAEDEANDWCLLKLKKASARPVLKLASTAAVLNEGLYMIGFPGGVPMKLADNARVTALALPGTNRFACDLDAFGGNSGAPVFSSRTHEVVGMLLEGNKDFEFIATGACKQVVKAPSVPELVLNLGVVPGLA